MTPSFRQLLLESGGHRDAVEHRIHRHAGQQLLLVQRNAELLVGLQQLGIDFVQALEPGLLLGRGVIDDVLVIDRRILDVGPLGSACAFSSDASADTPSAATPA